MIKTNIKNSANQIVVTLARQFILAFMEFLSAVMIKLQLSHNELIEKCPTLLGKYLAKQKLNFPIVPPLVAQFN